MGVIKVHDESLRCQTLYCPKAAKTGLIRYWCCYGCDDPDCLRRCHNDRERCNVAISGGSDTTEPWTEQEIDLLVEHYNGTTAQELLKLMPGRTRAAILAKAGRLGLSVPRTKRDIEEVGR